MPAKRKRVEETAPVPAPPVTSGGRTTRASARARGETVVVAAAPEESRKRVIKTKTAAVPVSVDASPEPEPAPKRGRRKGTREAPIELSSGSQTPVPTPPVAKRGSGGRGKMEAVVELQEDVRTGKGDKTTKGSKKKSVKPTVQAEDVQMEDVEPVPSKPPPPKKAAPKEDTFPPFSATRLNTLFLTYSDPSDPTVIPTSGLVQLCEDSGLEMDGVGPVVLAWQLKAKKMGVFEREEFVTGLGALRCDTPGKIGLAVSDLEAILYGLPGRKALKQEAYNRALFDVYASDPRGANKKLHQFLFGFAKGEQRVVEMETALALLSITLARYFPLAGEVCEYMQEKAGQTGYKSLTKDHWAMLFDFSCTVKEDLQGYKEEDAWPTLLDEFVEWKRAKQG